MRIALILSVILTLVSFSGCSPAGAGNQQVELRTVENSTVASMPVQPPPMITEQATELRPADELGPDGKPIVRPRTTVDPESEEEPLIEMPFAPLIAMDPVDGSKVSIRVGTPVADYNDRLYYFGSASNKAEFLRDPAKYAKGSLSKY